MNWKPSNVKANIGIYHAMSVFSSLDFSRAVFVLYLSSNGIGNTQTGVLQAYLFWSALILEIPSGFMADILKRKYSLLLGLILLVVSFLLYLLPPSFLLYVVIFCLIGSGFAFVSGASEALLFDGLKEAGKSWLEDHIKYMSRSRTYSSLALALACLAGGVAFEYDQQSVFILTSIALLGAVVCAFLIKEPSKAYLYQEDGRRRNILTDIRGFFKSDKGKDIFPFILGMSLVEGMHTPIFVYFQKFLEERGASGISSGFLMATAFIVSAVGTKLSLKIKKKNIFYMISTVSICLFILVFMLKFYLPLWIACFIFLMVNLLPHMLFVHTDQYIHESCPSEIRASLISIQSFCNSILYSFSFFIIGSIADRMTMSGALWWLCFLPLATCFIMYFMHKKLR